MAYAVVNTADLFMILDTFNKWLSYQMFCQAHVMIACYLPSLLMPPVEEVTNRTCLSPYRNKNSA